MEKPNAAGLAESGQEGRYTSAAGLTGVLEPLNLLRTGQVFEPRILTEGNEENEETDLRPFLFNVRGLPR